MKKSRAYLHSGLPVLMRKVSTKLLHTELVRYHHFLKQEQRSNEELLNQKVFSETEEAPLLSIVVPLYRTRPAYLSALIASVKASSYEKWELCLADGSGFAENDEGYGKILRQLMKPALADVRIRYKRLTENLGIAGNTNAALSMARGEWVLFADHDDMITNDALAEVALAAAKHPRAELIYSDEDKIHAGGGSGYDPHLKPDFDPALLESVNYISHLTAVRQSLLSRIGGLDGSFDGAQDYDFILRAAEEAEEIVHIDRVLYHWRCHRESTAKGLSAKAYAVDAGKRALAAHFQRLYGALPVQIRDGFSAGNYRVYFPVPENTELTILLWTGADLKRAERQKEALLREAHDGWDVCCVRDTELDAAARAAKGAYLLFLCADAQISGDDIRTLLGLVACKHAGAAGCMLTDDHGTIISAGQILDEAGMPFDAFSGYPQMEVGYMGRGAMMRSVSALPIHCLLISKKLYERTEAPLREAMELWGAALCAQVRALGENIVCVPYAHAQLLSRPQAAAKPEIRKHEVYITGTDQYYHRAFETRSPGFLMRR